MKKFLLSLLCCMFAVISSKADVTATLSFADKAQRTTYSTDVQVWEQNGIKVTNNKASSTNNVGDYANPARFYKNSELIVEVTASDATIKTIVFDCSGLDAKYVTALETSIADGSTVTTEDKFITIVPLTTGSSFTIPALSGGQARAKSVPVT